MKVKIGAEIEITDLLPLEFEKISVFLKNNYVISNPAFFKLQKMGKFQRNTPEHIVLYSRIKNGFLVPFRSIKKCIHLFKEL